MLTKIAHTGNFRAEKNATNKPVKLFNNTKVKRNSII